MGTAFNLEKTMINKFIPTMVIMLLLTNVPLAQASTSPIIGINVTDSSSDSINYFDRGANEGQELLVENGVSYDESTDATQRRGTENWEQSQGGFFVVPGVILGLLALVLFFDRK
jgi:hypothetical protein